MASQHRAILGRSPAWRGHPIGSLCCSCLTRKHGATMCNGFTRFKHNHSFTTSLPPILQKSFRFYALCINPPRDLTNQCREQPTPRSFWVTEQPFCIIHEVVIIEFNSNIKGLLFGPSSTIHCNPYKITAIPNYIPSHLPSPLGFGRHTSDAATGSKRCN